MKYTSNSGAETMVKIPVSAVEFGKNRENSATWVRKVVKKYKFPQLS